MGRGVSRGGDPAERGTTGYARAGDLCPPAPFAGKRWGNHPAAQPLRRRAGRATQPGGAIPGAATGARLRPRGQQAPVGLAGRAGEPGAAPPAKAIESARKPFAWRSPDAPGRSVDGDGGQATPVDGTAPGAGRPAAGGGTDAATCEVPLLDNRHRIPSHITMEDFFRPRSRGEVYHNGRVILSPDGEVLEVVTASRPIFKDAAFVACAEAQPKARGRAAGGDDGRAARRAKRELYLCAACNPALDCFVTFTQSPERVADRYDYKEAVRRLGAWLDNRVRRRGLKYIFVPERHQDGAIHWHGLCNADALRLVDSGHRDARGRIIYNVTDWTVGFTTATMIGEHAAACRYVSKYITKQTGGGTIGGRYWLHGGQLARPVAQLFDAAQPLAGARSYDLPEAGLRLWYGGDHVGNYVANYVGKSTTREDAVMDDKDGVHYAEGNDVSAAGNDGAKRAYYPAVYGDGLAFERLSGAPMAGSASQWADMGRIELNPGWAADWLPDDDPRRYYQIDREQDGENPGGAGDGQGTPGIDAAVASLQPDAVDIPRARLEQTPVEAGGLERSQAGQPDTTD